MSTSCDSRQTQALLLKIQGGSQSALEQLLALHRGYLKQLDTKRLGPELQARVDPSDIVQETQVAIAHRIREFIEQRPGSFRLWVRQLAIDRLIDQWRRHVAAEKRTVRREEALPDVSVVIAREFVVSDPAEALQRREVQTQVREIIELLAEKDRQVLTLRHVDGLSNVEIAELLQIDPNTARQRYGRALRRLHQRIVDRGIQLEDTEA